MTAKSKKVIEDLPPGLSPAEEADWWDAHKDYWDGPDIINEVVGPLQVRRTAPVTLRLPVDLIEALKVEAARRDVAYQTLIRMWLDDRLAAETRTT